MREYQHVRGLRELEQNLKALGEKVGGKAMTRALMAGGRVIRDDARRRAPTLSTPPTNQRHAGVMRAAIIAHAKRWNLIFVRVRNLGSPKRNLERQRKGWRRRRGVESPLNPYYWWHVEFGTRHMRARPFMRPAFEANKQTALEKIKASMQRTIQRAAREMRKTA